MYNCITPLATGLTVHSLLVTGLIMHNHLVSHQLPKYPLLIKGGTSKSTQTMSSNGNIIYKWLMFAKFDSRRVFSLRIFWLVVYLPL